MEIFYVFLNLKTTSVKNTAKWWLYLLDILFLICFQIIFSLASL